MKVYSGSCLIEFHLQYLRCFSRKSDKVMSMGSASNLFQPEGLADESRRGLKVKDDLGDWVLSVKISREVACPWVCYTLPSVNFQALCETSELFYVSRNGVIG